MTHRLSGDVASHNISNATTPGYSRQRADLQARQPWLSMVGPMGTGVKAVGIDRIQDGLLFQRLMDAGSDSGFGSSKVAVLQAAQTVVGIGDDDPVAASMNSFFQAMEDLSANPSGMAERQQVLDKAAQLGTTMAQVRDELDGIRKDLDAQLTGVVDEIQGRLDEIAVLNKEVRLTEASGGQANDLRDRRELLAREVADRIGAKIFSDDDGNLNLMLNAGGTLVEGDTASHLELQPNPSNGGLLDPVVVSGAGVRTVLDSSISGQLGGLLSSRDKELAKSILDLDTLAFEVAGQVNAIHQTGFGLDGVSGRNLFSNIAVVDGAASNLTVDAAVLGQPDAVAAAQNAGALPGDNRIALAMAALAQSDTMSGGTRTFSEYLLASESDLGAGLQNAQRDAQLHADRLSQLSSMRESVSGVSIDEEMVELTKAQRAFEAAAKVIKTGDELLETIMGLK